MPRVVRAANSRMRVSGRQGRSDAGRPEWRGIGCEHACGMLAGQRSGDGCNVEWLRSEKGTAKGRIVHLIEKWHKVGGYMGIYRSGGHESGKGIGSGTLGCSGHFTLARGKERGEGQHRTAPPLRLLRRRCRFGQVPKGERRRPKSGKCTGILARRTSIEQNHCRIIVIISSAALISPMVEDLARLNF